MKTSIQIGKIMGIPIRLHITFLLILPVFAWIFARSESGLGGFSDVQPELLRYSLGMAASILLFTCVLLHETELKMAVAGPAVSLIIGLALISIHEIIKQELLFRDSPYMRLVWLIGYINVVLCIFNLIPAFPMDGGRVLRA